MLVTSIGISFYLFMPLWAHLVTLRSLRRQNQEVSSSRRFSLADGMILTALIAIGTAIGSYAKIDRNTENWILILSLNLLLILMWYKCNQFMQKNGIFENKSRIVMQIFTYPSSILALSFFLLSCLSVTTGIVASLAPLDNAHVVRELPNNVVCLLFSWGWIYLTRQSFSAILKRNPVESAG